MLAFSRMRTTVANERSAMILFFSFKKIILFIFVEGGKFYGRTCENFVRKVKQSVKLVLSLESKYISSYFSIKSKTSFSVLQKMKISLEFYFHFVFLKEKKKKLIFSLEWSFYSEYKRFLISKKQHRFLTFCLLSQNECFIPILY